MTRLQEARATIDAALRRKFAAQRGRAWMLADGRVDAEVERLHIPMVPEPMIEREDVRGRFARVSA